MLNNKTEKHELKKIEMNLSDSSKPELIFQIYNLLNLRLGINQ